MSSCLVLQGKNFIAIGADTASSIMFNGCYKRIETNAKKLYHFGNEIMFCSGRMDLVESVTSNTFLINNKIDLNKLTKFINSMNIKKSDTYDLEILICGVENNKSYIHQISQYNNFKVKTITNETNRCAVYSTGFNSKLMLSTAKKNYSIHKNITNLFIRSFEEISSEEVGGYMNMYLIQENQITKCIDEYKVDDIKPIKIETKDVHFVVADVLIGDLIAGETLMISNGSKTFIVDKDGIIVNNMKLDMYSADKKHRILIDPDLKSMFNIYSEDKQVFFVDENGNIVMNGNLYINNNGTYLKADMTDENIIEIGKTQNTLLHSIGETKIPRTLEGRSIYNLKVINNELYGRDPDNRIYVYNYMDNMWDLVTTSDKEMLFYYNNHYYVIGEYEGTLCMRWFSDFSGNNLVGILDFEVVYTTTHHVMILDNKYEQIYVHFGNTIYTVDLINNVILEKNDIYKWIGSYDGYGFGYDLKLFDEIIYYTKNLYFLSIYCDEINKDGKVYLVKYDTSSKEFTKLIEMDESYRNSLCYQLGNQIYLFGKGTLYGDSLLDEHYLFIYDIDTGKYIEESSMPFLTYNENEKGCVLYYNKLIISNNYSVDGNDTDYYYFISNDYTNSSNTNKIFYITNQGDLSMYGNIYAKSLTLGSNVTIDTSNIKGLDDRLKDINDNFEGISNNVIYAGDIITTTEKLENGIIKTTNRVPTGKDSDGNIIYEDNVTYTSADGNYVMTDVGLGDKEKESGTYVVISKDGLLEAVNAKVSGTIYASAGKFGGWDIGKNGLKSELFDDASNTNGIRLDSNGEIRSKGSWCSSVNNDGSDGWFARLCSGKWIFGYYDKTQSDPFIPPANTPYSDISVNGIYMCSRDAIQNKNTQYLFEVNTLNDTVNITNSSKSSPALTITNNYYDSTSSYDAPALVLHSPKQGYRNRPLDVRLKVTGKLLGTDQTVDAQYSVALFGEEQLGRIIFRSNTFDTTSSPVGNTVSDTSSNPTVPSILGSDTFRWYQGYFMELYSKNGVNTSSDRKIKNHIDYIDGDKSLEFVNQLKPVEYTLKNNANERKHMGFYAQDVKDVADSLEMGNMSLYSAVWNKDGNEYYYSEDAPDEELSWTLKYEEFIAPLVGSVQELTKRDKENKDRINKLEDTVESLLSEIKSLKEQMNK